MSDMQSILEEKIEEIERECGIDGYPAVYMEEYIRQQRERILSEYISDDGNYVVDGAIISCNQMSDKPVTIKYNGNGMESINGEEGGIIISNPERERAEKAYETCYGATFDDEIKKLSAVHATNQTVNGRCFATVTDCICLRNKEELNLENDASIISLGNCKIIKKTDIREIESRQEKAHKYGTCYCLIKPDFQWENPLCMESMTSNCHLEPLLIGGVERVLNPVSCTDQFHHKTMEWSTEAGKKEGLTKFSTLLCTRGGIITIVETGQNMIAKPIENVKNHIMQIIRAGDDPEQIRAELEEYLNEIKEENPDYASFLDLLGMREGSGSYDPPNSTKYLGKYQIGPETLEQIDFKDNSGEWTNLARAIGVNSNDDFKRGDGAVIAQEVAILFSIRWDYQYVLTYGADEYIDQIIEEECGGKEYQVEVTLSGLIAAYHLVGVAPVNKALRGVITWEEAKDGNGTYALDYMSQMGGLDLSGILGGIE